MTTVVPGTSLSICSLRALITTHPVSSPVADAVTAKVVMVAAESAERADAAAVVSAVVVVAGVRAK
jgi:hypothetical protein